MLAPVRNASVLGLLALLTASPAPGQPAAGSFRGLTNQNRQYNFRVASGGGSLSYLFLDAQIANCHFTFSSSVSTPVTGGQFSKTYTASCVSLLTGGTFSVEKRYAPYVEGVASRQDLNYLFEEMLAELTCGHVFVAGGDMPEVKRVGGGLLGADYKIENGRYRFARVYDGENWNPRLRAPLTQPGVNVAAGEYLLAVNGREVTAAEEVYRPFEAPAGKQTVIKVGPSPDGKGAREVTVVPVGNEYSLRNLAWVEDNRRKVEKLSGGKLAYAWLPDTAGGGYSNFNRYFFSQLDKQGAVIDERFRLEWRSNPSHVVTELQLDGVGIEIVLLS